MRILPFILVGAVLSGAFVGPAGAADKRNLEAIEAEANPKKRSKFALEYARKTVSRMVKAFEQDDAALGRQLLDRIVEAVHVSEAALEDLDKNPRKSPKHFKHAEIETRKLVRDLEDAKRRLTVGERPNVEKVQEQVQEINRGLLTSILAPKRR